MKKSIFLFFSALLFSASAWAGWCGNSFITVNGLWCTGSHSHVHDGGKFHGKDLGTLTTLELGGEFQVWPSSTTAGTLCYKIDNGTENSISLPKTGTEGNNSKHSGSGAVDLSGLAGGSHSIAVWFKHGSDIDNNGGSNFVATFTIAAATPEPEPDPEPVADVTVHFINTPNWAEVACHHWIPNGAGTSWPGDVLSKTDEIAGYDVYTATFTGAHTSCIFNNNNKGSQTGDLTVYDGKYYEVNTNTWYADKAAAEAALATPIPDETVYLINTGNWSKVMIHTWNGVGGTAWPGVEMTPTGETIEGYAVYSYTAKQGGQANLLFQESENVNKTGDLTWQAGKYYAPLKNEWYDTKEAAAEALAAPVEYEYVYLINTNDWAAAHIYTWTPEVAGWPGAAMTKEAEQIAGKDVYSYKVVKGTTFGGLNFNCGGDECKTGDLTWQAGKYYAPSKGEWYDTKEAAAEALATPVVVTYELKGVGGWDQPGIELVQNPDPEKASEYMLTCQAISATDAIKVVRLEDGVIKDYYGNGTVKDGVQVSVNYDGDGNITLPEGKYNFYFDTAESEKKLWIADCPNIDVTLSGMVKTPVSRMGRYSYLSLDDEDGNRFSIYNGSEDAYGDFEVSGYLADDEVTVAGNGTWEVVDDVETLTATLQAEENPTAIYHVTATVGVATTITLECYDATYTITDPELNEVTFTGIAAGKEFTILVAPDGAGYYSDGEWDGTPILGTSVEFDDSDASEYYLGGTYIDEAGNTYEVAIFGAPAAEEPEVTEITLTEGDNSDALATEGVVTVTVERVFEKEHLYTIALPFTINNAASVFGYGTVVYNFANLAYDKTNEEYILGFTTVGKIEAGKPYLIEPGQDVSSFVAENVTLSPATSISQKVTVDKVEKTATMTAVLSETTTGGSYWLAENRYLYNDNVDMPALRALFVLPTTPSGMPARARVALKEDAATGVEDLFTTDAPVKAIVNGQLIIIRDGVKYNVQGQVIK